MSHHQQQPPKKLKFGLIEIHLSFPFIGFVLMTLLSQMTWALKSSSSLSPWRKLSRSSNSIRTHLRISLWEQNRQHHHHLPVSRNSLVLLHQPKPQILHSHRFFFDHTHNIFSTKKATGLNYRSNNKSLFPSATISKLSAATRNEEEGTVNEMGNLQSSGSRSIIQNNDDAKQVSKFQQGDKIEVEIVRFSHLGASVDVIGLGHVDNDNNNNNEESDNLLDVDEEPYGRGLILQSEIKYFRDSRKGLDVLVGEILPAYVENIREDGKLDICLRVPGGRGKAEELGQNILNRLKSTPKGMLPVGDKSSPAEINAEFPGASKSSFKKAVSGLFKKGLVKPGPNSIMLMKNE